MAHAHAALFGAPQLEFDLGICEAWMEGKDLDCARAAGGVTRCIETRPLRRPDFTGLLQTPLAEISFDFPVCEAVAGQEDAATEHAKARRAPPTLLARVCSPPFETAHPLVPGRARSHSRVRER